MSKLSDLRNSFGKVKKIVAFGEEISIKRIVILESIDDVLTDYDALMKQPDVMEALAEAAGGNQLYYTGQVAELLRKVKDDIEALG